MKRFVYADNAATTRVSEEVVAAMLPYFSEQYGNASSPYRFGQASKEAIQKAREQVAAALGAEKPLPNRLPEVFFTSCGTESDNWALKGVMHAMAKRGKRHLITTNFEHHAILHSAQALEKEGFSVTYLPVDHEGLITPEQVADAIREDTALVSVLYANNEIGTLLPIPEIGAVCHDRGVLFHTDAVQAVGNVPIDVKAQHIDLLSLSGHKLHAPKGIGALYIRKGVVLPSLIDGGAQEFKHRAGTENVPYIVGLGTAIEAACRDIPARAARLQAMRDRLIDDILERIPHARLNGSRTRRLPGNVNFSFEGIEGEGMLLWLDQEGICASSGSACTSGDLDPSHVLLAIGLPHGVAHGSLRLSLGDDNTMEDVDYILEKLPPIVERLRAMSPVWERILAGEPVE